jgi:preprotein translocase subunit YajC
MGFIADAFAQAAAPAGPSGFDAVLQTIAPLLLLIPIFYFLLIRPQQRRAKAHQDMINALRKGDMVVTSGGFIGKIKGVAEDELRLELAPNVEVRVQRGAITEVRNKGEPAPANDTKPAKSAQ